MTLYNQLQDQVGHVLEIGRCNDLLEGGAAAALAEPPAYAYRRTFCRLINTMSHRFDRPIPERLLHETRMLLLEEHGASAREHALPNGPIRIQPIRTQGAPA